MPVRRRNRDPKRLSRFEVLGAWLHLWTPHRDAEVPPVPVRRILVGALIGLVVVSGAALLIVPAIDQAKRRGAERDARALAASQARQRHAIEVAQTPHHGRAARPRDLAQLGDQQQLALRSDLLRRSEAAVLADARQRVADGRFKNPVQTLQCRKTPPGSDPHAPGAEADLAAPRGAYDCIAITRFVPNGADRGALGYPFRLVVDYRRFAYVWCKSTPVPGEQALPNPRTVVLLPPECRAAEG
jgi:gas vesicle protein